MAESSRRLRASLRQRLALWALSSTLTTLALFGAGVFVVVAADERQDRLQGESAESANAEGAEAVVWAMLLAGVPAVLLAVGGALWLARRALLPLEDVIAGAEQFSHASLSRRLPVPARDDELRALTLALNQLFARLEEGFAALGRYASDASHELRTPLTVLCTDLEVALRHPRTVAEWEALARRSLSELQHLSSLVETLLELARAGTEPTTPMETVELRDLIDQALVPLGRVAQGALVSIEQHVLGSTLRCHPDALGSAVRALVDNAVRHAPRGRVRITARENDDGVVIDVDDDGPGVAPERREQILAPFARAPDSPGLGLGTTLARRIAEARGGTLTVGEAPELGGARFSLFLPK
jgi:signal transduction histidine kinase